MEEFALTLLKQIEQDPLLVCLLAAACGILFLAASARAHARTCRREEQRRLEADRELFR